jgi:hypothetical protein
MRTLKYGVQATNKFRHRRKIKCIEYKGGKCQRCGYAKCIRALEFHHPIRQDKDRRLRTKKDGFNLCLSWARLVKELDKCELLCANCHREVEDTLLST